MKNNYLKNRPFLIMSHRGFWGGNIIQNTRQSAQLAQQSGADIIEIDICRTSDGIYYLFHDDNERTLLGVDINFNLLSSYEIEGRDMFNSVGEESGYKVETLDDFLTWLPENYIINIDRSWEYWEDPHFFELIEKSGKVNQLIIKSPANEKFLNILNELSFKIPYVMIAKEPSDIRLVHSFKNINFVGVELVADSLKKNPLFHEATLNYIDDLGLLTIANAEHLGKHHELFGNLNDSNALLHRGEEVWKEILSFNIDVIQTDWPNFLEEFRNKLNS